MVLLDTAPNHVEPGTSVALDYVVAVDRFGQLAAAGGFDEHFTQWAWDGQLFGALMSGPGLSLIDSTYSYGFDRLRGKLPPDTFEGYPSDYHSTGYNAGYGTWGLASDSHRDQGIVSTSS